MSAREDGLGENPGKGISMGKGQELGVSVACAPGGEEGPCFRGAYNRLVPSTSYSVLPFDFGRRAKLMQLQFTKNIPAVSKEISIPSSLGLLISIRTARCPVIVPASLPGDALTFLVQVVLSLSNDASMPGTSPSHTNTEAAVSFEPLIV